MRQKLWIVAVGLWLSSCASSASTATSRNRLPIGFWSLNEYDRTGERHGRWNAYYDEQYQKIGTKGRFKHGQPVGRWRYYSLAGQLERQEVYLRRPAGRQLITYYHPNGRVAKRGQAQFETDATDAHFYWLGDWTSYSPTGQPEKIETYNTGKLQSVRKL
ncbi:hypothetical protein [Hymenobacter sp. HDW8]|uniref:hypothetical protein n=1 Tax=Hymenobacter sp. HDW8 TaxID=2714932 RepID=UPI00140C1AC7|nr:hypothetical protein [Hymenobacter sp. HDW8]QIL76455.1 hypothetical protein G7064_11725 [Hymenobacter sp. HDW8]